MSHVPNKFDAITDIRRAISASYSDGGFSNENFVTFLRNAEEILESLSKSEKYNEAKIELVKAKNNNLPIEKRRENLLMAANLLS